MTARPSAINVVFDGPPGPIPGRFVEVETDDGKGVSIGEWADRGDGTWVLRIEAAELAHPAPELPVTLCGHGSVICALCDFIPSSWRPQL